MGIRGWVNMAMVSRVPWDPDVSCPRLIIVVKACLSGADHWRSLLAIWEALSTRLAHLRLACNQLTGMCCPQSTSPESPGTFVFGFSVLFQILVLKRYRWLSSGCKYHIFMLSLLKYVVRAICASFRKVIFIVIYFWFDFTLKVYNCAVLFWV